MESKVIGYIEKGIVIDHIPKGNVWRIIDLFKVSKRKGGRVSIGEGYVSNKIGEKGILKIEGMKLTENELNLVSLVAEHASVSIIENGVIVKKLKAEIPKVLKGIIKCNNVNCITNDSHESVETLINYNDNLFKCHFCDSEFKKDKIRFS